MRNHQQKLPKMMGMKTTSQTTNLTKETSCRACQTKIKFVKKLKIVKDNERIKVLFYSTFKILYQKLKKLIKVQTKKSQFQTVELSKNKIEFTRASTLVAKP